MSALQRVFVPILLAIVLVSSGCVGFLTGSEALTFEATPGTVSSDALSETGYEYNGTNEVQMTRTFEVADQKREVMVTNHLSEYQRTIDLGTFGGERKAAVFAVFTTPQVKIAGETFNPVGEMSNRELLEQLQSRYETIQIDERVERNIVTTLGTDATVETYAGQANLGGVNVDIRVQITTVKHDGDFVIAIGVYPRLLPGEDETVRNLIRGLEHGS